MATPAVDDIPLQTQPLPDGVRYVLPARRRAGWLGPLGSALFFCILYFTVPATVVLAVVHGAAPFWWLLIGVAVVVLSLGNGLTAIRTAVDVLAIPAVSVELRPGRVVITRRVLGRNSSGAVPLAELRRLTVRSWFGAAEAKAVRPPPPSAPGVMNGLRRMWRVWTQTRDAAEEARAELRKLEVLRFFGELTIEGDGEARMPVAEGYSLRYLGALARDLVARLATDSYHVEVRTIGPTEAPADEGRRVRPKDQTNIKAGATVLGFMIEVPPSSLSGINALPMLAGGIALLAIGGGMSSGSGGSLGPVLLYPALFLGFGSVLLGRALHRFWRTQLRTFLYIRGGELVTEYDAPVGSWQRTWQLGDLAALTSRQRRLTRSAKIYFVYDLLILDHAMRARVVLRDRVEAEADWLIALLHHELGLES